jgi:hypothetical protein
MIAKVNNSAYVNSLPKNGFRYEKKLLNKKKDNIRDSASPQIIVG